MTVFEDITSKNIDEFAKWLNENGSDNSPWILWFDEKYCRKCKGVPINESEPWKKCAWCELHNKCRFFADIESVPDCLQIAKMWLESEV
jgi:hypothetical protein